MTLELKKFDMRWITFKPDENKGPVIVMIGRRDTGKSFLVRDLLYHHQDIPIGTVISGTEAGNGFFSAHVPKLFIHDEYNTAIIENILKRQKTVLKQVQKEAVWDGVVQADSQWCYVKEHSVRQQMREMKKNITSHKSAAKKLSTHILENFSEEKILRSYRDLYGIL